MGKKQIRKQKSNKSESKKASKSSNNGGLVGVGVGVGVSFQQEIVSEILSRLPVKSLLRFRSISKPWQSIIDNSSFAYTHLTCSYARRSGGRVLLSFSNFDGSRHYFYSSSLGGGESVRVLSLPGCDKGSNNSPCQCYVSESINGVICFFNGTQVYVCNPSTRDIVTVSPTNEIELYVKYNSFFNVSYSCFSLGFDSFSKEYKVLHIFGTRHGMNTTRLYDMQCQVLTVKATREPNDELKSSNLLWRKIGYVPPYPYMFKTHGVYVNGVIHWIDMKSPGEEVLVAFNVASEKFHLIPLPEGNMPSKPNLTQIRGRLALFGYEDCGYNSIGLWVLEDYHKLLWIKNNINVASSQNHKGVKVVLVGSDYTGDMLLTQSMFTHHYDLIPCCHENRTASTRTIRIRGLPPWIDLYGAKNINFRIANHVESLVPLAPIDMQFGDFVVHDA